MAYLPPLNGGRLNASFGGNTAGASMVLSTGTMVLAGGNNITLSQTTGANGATVSIVGGTPTASINFSASNASANLASVTFSNSNGVSFGLNAGVITASHNGLTSQSNQALSASNGSFAFQTAAFSDANGVTFGTSAGGIISASVNTSYAGSNHSHGNPTLNLTNLSGTTASASNGLTLSLSAAAQSNQSMGFSADGTTTLTSTGTLDARSFYIKGAGNAAVGFSAGSILVSASQSQSTAPGAISANGGSVTSGTLSFANSNGVSFGMNGQTLTASHAMIISASNTSSSLSALTFANSNGVTFGLTNGSLTASAAGGGGGGTLTMYGVGNTTQNSSTSLDVRSVSLNGLGAMTVGYSNGSVQLSAPVASSVSATGIVSISTNGSTVSIGAPAFSVGISSNTAGTAGSATNQVILAGGNNITLSQSTGAGGNTISIVGGAGGGGTLTMYGVGNTTQGSTTSLDVRSVSLNGLGAMSVGYSNGSVQLSAPVTSSLIGTSGITLSTTSNSIYVGGMMLSRWEYPDQVFSTLNNVHVSSVSIERILVPYNVTASAGRIAASFSANTFTSASTATVSLSVYMNIYTLSGSTLSAVTTGSQTYSMSWGNTAASTSFTSLINGIRALSVPMNINMTPGAYWVGAHIRSATTNASLLINLMGDDRINSGGVMWDLGANTTSGASVREVYLGQGIVSTSAIQTSIALSTIINSANNYVQRAAFYHAFYNASY
jgi:hypothetical protein